jgi:uncharacterized integral membrane protein
VNNEPGRPSGVLRILRGLRRLVTTVIALAFIVAAWVFTLENRETVAVRFAHWIVHLPMALALFTAFLIGVLLTLFVVVPRWWGWRLRYHLLQHRHARLVGRSGEADRKEADP